MKKPFPRSSPRDAVVQLLLLAFFSASQLEVGSFVHSLVAIGPWPERPGNSLPYVSEASSAFLPRVSVPALANVWLKRVSTWMHRSEFVSKEQKNMYSRGRKRYSREVHDANGVAGRPPHSPRRVSSCPLLLPSAGITATQAALVREVIALAEAADHAEATRARRPTSAAWDACRMPEFGSDLSDYLPTAETRKVRKLIDSQCFENRVALLAVMNAGRADVYMTVTNVAWLLSNAGVSAANAGYDMTRKSALVSWLTKGLRKFEAFTSRMSRRRIG